MSEPIHLDGIHHVKLPVSDIVRSRAWYETRLNYELEIEFIEEGRLMGVSLRHPAGGPRIALRLDPERARAIVGFDYFSIGVPDQETIEALAARMTELGETHHGVHFATIGWILPGVTDPDGHEVRFYTTVHHTGSDSALVAHDPRETSAAREAEYLGR